LNLDIIKKAKDYHTKTKFKGVKAEHFSSQKSQHEVKQDYSFLEEKSFKVEDLFDLIKPKPNTQLVTTQDLLETKEKLRIKQILEIYKSEMSCKLRRQMTALKKSSFFEIDKNYDDNDYECFMNNIQFNEIGKKFYHILNCAVIGKLDLTNAGDDLDLLITLSKEITLKDANDIVWNVWGIILCYQSTLIKFFNFEIVFQIMKFDILKNIFNKIRTKILNVIILNSHFENYVNEIRPEFDISKRLKTARKSLRNFRPKSSKKKLKKDNFNVFNSHDEMNYKDLFEKFNDPTQFLNKTRKQVYEEGASKRDHDISDFKMELFDEQIDLEIEEFYEDLNEDMMKLSDSEEENEESNKIDLESFKKLQTHPQNESLLSFLYFKAKDPLSFITKENNDEGLTRTKTDFLGFNLNLNRKEMIDSIKEELKDKMIFNKMKEILKLLKKSSKIIQVNLNTYCKLKSKILYVLERLMMNFGFSTLEQKNFTRMDLFTISNLKMTYLIQSLISGNFKLTESKALFNIYFVFQDLVDFTVKLKQQFKDFSNDIDLGKFDA
jgi:hypothetical protein